MCRHGQAAGRGSGGPPPRRMSAPRADSCGGTSPWTCGGEGGARSVAADDAATRPWQTSTHVDGRAGVSPRTSGEEGRGSGIPSLRRLAPRANGRGRMSLRRPRDSRSNCRPARTAARVCHRGQAMGRESGRGRGTAKKISAPHGRPRRCVAEDKRWGGEGERRPVAAEISVPRKRSPGDVAAEAAGQPQQLSPRADGRTGMSPQTSDREEEWTRPRDGQCD